MIEEHIEWIKRNDKKKNRTKRIEWNKTKNEKEKCGMSQEWMSLHHIHNIVVTQIWFSSILTLNLVEMYYWWLKNWKNVNSWLFVEVMVLWSVELILIGLCCIVIDMNWFTI